MNRFALLLSIFILFVSLFGLLVTAQDSASEGPLPQGPHVDLVYAKCQSCHNLKYVTDSKGLPPFLWEDTINLMVQLGMQASEEEQENLLTYLTTYMGPNPPPESAEGSTEGVADAPQTDSSASGGELSAQAEAVDGEALYNSNCSSCHQQNGQGVAGAFPPLVEHAPALYGAKGGRDYLANLMLYGLQGQIQAKGEMYNNVMPAWTQLGNAELAAILNHTLTAWENEALLPEDFTPYAAEDLAAKRDQGLSAQDMLARRPEIDSD